MATAATKLVTAEEFFEFCQRPENQDRSFELDRGEIVELPRPRIPHGVVCGNAAYLLVGYTHRRRRGNVVGNDAGVIVERGPDTVFGPDVFLYDEVRRFDELEPKWSERPPTLVVDVGGPAALARRAHAANP